MRAGPDAAGKIADLELLATRLPEGLPPDEQAWLEQARDDLAITQQPSEWDDLWRAFWRLDDERPHIVTGVAHPLGGILIKSIPRRIPWSAVLRWCQVYGIDLDLAERCIGDMDAIYLKELASRGTSQQSDTGVPGRDP